MGVLYLGKNFLNDKSDLTASNEIMPDKKHESTFNKIYQNDKEIVYVSQDNYYVADLDSGKDIVYYCDSATSCIVIISVGYSEDYKKNLAVVSHLSRPGRFKDYFSKVEALFKGEIDIYAAGANPAYPCLKKDGSYDYTALRNATQVSQWVSSRSIEQESQSDSSGSVKVRQASLKFGQGNPSIYNNNLDCYSIACDKNSNITVSNDRIYLTEEQRDPTGGVQTLFCMYGNPDLIRNQAESFSDDEIAVLVQTAHDNNLEQASEMTDKEILNTYSSTPQYEVPWFCDSIRQAGLFVKTYMKGM